MYIVEIIDTKNKARVGKTFFTGEGEDYDTLADGRAAAEEWIKNTNSPEDYKVVSRIVGCL